MEKWFVQTKKADFEAIGQKFKINPVIARLIRNRDLITEQEIDYYLHGDLQMLHSPWQMKDMRNAVAIIMKKIAAGKRIRIVGDYDIDGVNASYILLTGLKNCGANVDSEIPDRMKDGYGINEHLIQLAYDDGVDTIVTCDNGIAAIDQIAYAKELGMTVVVTDHHDIPYREAEDGSRIILRSQADAIVNPKQEECSYPFDGLCGAAVAYKLVECLYEEYQIPKTQLYQLLDYAAIATIGDVMDLRDENRVIVKEGLKRLRRTTNPGLSALISINGIEKEKLSSYHIGFVIGPCINASGRLDTAKRALQLLCTDDPAAAQEIAGDLKALNDSRKDMTAKGVEEAVAQVENSALKNDRVLVLYLPDCHESLAGIIAGRVREKYNKPVFVLTKAEEGVKGSGRSIEAYNMFEEMVKCRDLFTKFGGHPMAAGLSLSEANVPLFRQQINQLAELTDEDLVAKVSIDVAMPIDYLTESLVTELEILEPFGKGNPKPLFAEKEIRLLSGRILGKNSNVLKLQVLNKQGTLMDAMYFGNVETFNEYLTDKYGAVSVNKLYDGKAGEMTLALTYYPSINEFNGRRTLQIIIQNYQ